MPVSVPTPQRMARYVDPQTGRLTTEGIILLAQVVRAIEDHETRLVALEP